MARKPPKTPRRPPESPPHRHSSVSPQHVPVPPTPRCSIPLNFLLRALSTPPRPPSHHPFLRAFSTPIRRRSEYSPLVRRLCQQGAYDRLPYDNDTFVKKVLPCKGCEKMGMMTQNIAFKQGHAGEWVRVCRNVGCGLIYYPAQPGTPPDLLQGIKAARDADACSSTVTTPESLRSRSSAFFSSAPSPIGGELEDWLSLLLAHASITSSSGNLEPVAGPSTRPDMSASRDASPQCARDEQIARMLQDALFLQQLEEESPSISPRQTGDGDEQPATLSSLTAELAAITQSQPVRTEKLPVDAPAPVDNTPSRCSSPESSPSPRPCKKKRILLKPSPTPPPVKQKIYGPVPPAPSTKTRGKAIAYVGNPRPAKLDQPHMEKLQKPVANKSKAGATRSAQRDDKPPLIISLLSSDDECAPPTRRAKDGAQSDAAPPRRQPRIARSHHDPPTAHPLRAPLTHPSGDDESDSDPGSDRAPLATRPLALALASRCVADCSDQAHDDCERNVAPRRTEPPAARSGTVLRPARLPPLPTPPHLDRPLTIQRHALPTPAAMIDSESAIIDITTTSESDDGSTPPLTQPRTASSRAVIRSRAPSLEVAAHTCPAHDNSEDHGTPPDTQLPRNRSRGLQAQMQVLPAAASEAGSSNKENSGSNAVQSSVNSQRSARLSARQAAARHQVGVFTTLAQTSSSTSSSSLTSSALDKNISNDEGRDNSDATVRPVAQVQSGADHAGERVDAAEAFGDPFRFELYPVVPGLVTSINPYAERRRWILTVKIWYKNNLPPSTKMIALEHTRCSIRLCDVFIIARTFQSTGFADFHVWNRATTDWDTRSRTDYLAVSVTDNYTLLVRFPTVRTLASWAENISQAYGLCQTIDPQPSASRKGKELAYY